MVPDGDKKIINETKAVLHLNRCMTRVKMKKWNDAIWDANKSIELMPKNSKATYRRCLIYLGFLGEELDKEEKGVFWDVEKAKE